VSFDVFFQRFVHGDAEPSGGVPPPRGARGGTASLAKRAVLAAEILGGRRVGIPTR
jgi:hypothetical protein